MTKLSCMISHFSISSFVQRERVIHLRNVVAIGTRILCICGCTNLCCSVAKQSCLVFRFGPYSNCSSPRYNCTKAKYHLYYYQSHTDLLILHASSCPYTLHPLHFWCEIIWYVYALDGYQLELCVNRWIHAVMNWHWVKSSEQEVQGLSTRMGMNAEGIYQPGQMNKSNLLVGSFLWINCRICCFLKSIV